MPRRRVSDSVAATIAFMIPSASQGRIDAVRMRDNHFIGAVKNHIPHELPASVMVNRR